MTAKMVTSVTLSDPAQARRAIRDTARSRCVTHVTSATTVTHSGK